MEIRKRAILQGLIAILCGIALLMMMPNNAYAYTLKVYKMDSQIWYNASSVFKEISRNDMRDAMREWNNYIPENRRLCYDPATHNQDTYIPGKDGYNRIYKNVIENDENNNIVIANNICSYYISSGILTESDIIFNTNVRWNNGAYPNDFDVKTIMTHELGHTVGLDHSQYSTAVMYAYSSPNTLKTKLTDDDINGLYARYQ